MAACQTACNADPLPPINPSAAADAPSLRKSSVGTHLIEFVETGIEGTILVGEVVHIRRKVQRGKLGKRMLPEVVGLATVQAKRLEHLSIGQHFGRVHAAADPSQQVLPARIVHVGQVELANVAPVPFVARLSKVLGTSVCIERIVEPIAKRHDVAAGPSRGFDDRDVVSSTHQFPRATQPADTRPRDDDFLRCRRAQV